MNTTPRLRRYIVRFVPPFRFAVVDTTTGTVVEGGFFDKGHAIVCCAAWNAQTTPDDLRPSYR